MKAKILKRKEKQQKIAQNNELSEVFETFDSDSP
jgi:hypothetical protein